MFIGHPSKQLLSDQHTVDWNEIMAGKEGERERKKRLLCPPFYTTISFIIIGLFIKMTQNFYIWIAYSHTVETAATSN